MNKNLECLSKNRNSQNGQVLLFVIVTMTIALAVGVGVSLRTISSISRVSKSDTSARVLAAAEGGLETFLTKTNNELALLTNACTSDNSQTAPSQCKVTFTSSVDQVDTVAVVQVLELGANDPSYKFNVKKDQVFELNLSGYDSHPSSVGTNEIQLCWRAQTGQIADLYYLAYSPSAIIKNGACYAGNCNPSGVVVRKTGFNTGFTGANGYPSCFTIGSTAGSTDLPDDVVGLRIRSLGADAEFEAFTVNSGQLPLQGYEIVSTGELVDVSNVRTVKRVRATRSLPYLPGMFDFGLYSDTGTID